MDRRDQTLTANTLHPDSSLMEASETFEKMWVLQNVYFENAQNIDADIDDAVINATALVVDIIESLPAKSLDGLMAKARAVLWCHCGALPDMSSQTQDVRLAFGIVADILKMGR